MIYVIMLNGDEYLFTSFNEAINNVDIAEIDKYFDMLIDVNTAEYVISNFFD